MCKKTYVLTTKNGTNEVVNIFADYHQYIEDLFDIPFEQITATQEQPLGLPADKITENIEQKARDAVKMLFQSELWKNVRGKGKDVSLRGYSSHLSKIWRKETIDQIERYFHAAHTLELIELYNNIDGKLNIREGNKSEEILKLLQVNS